MSEQNFTVEFRVEVRASSPAVAADKARELVAEEGQVTAIFDENFDELTGGPE